MDPIQELERASDKQHRDGEGTLGIDFPLVAELGLLETLDAIKAHLADHELLPAATRIVLSASGGGERKGNPADWAEWEGQTIAVYNANAFSIFLGQGAGSGTVDKCSVVVAANRLVVLPLRDRIYSFGTAAANVAGGDVQLFAWRYSKSLAPAAYAL